MYKKVAVTPSVPILHYNLRSYSWTRSVESLSSFYLSPSSSSLSDASQEPHFFTVVETFSPACVDESSLERSLKKREENDDAWEIISNLLWNINKQRHFPENWPTKNYVTSSARVFFAAFRMSTTSNNFEQPNSLKITIIVPVFIRKLQRDKCYGLIIAPRRTQHVRAARKCIFPPTYLWG